MTVKSLKLLIAVITVSEVSVLRDALISKGCIVTAIILRHSIYPFKNWNGSYATITGCKNSASRKTDSSRGLTVRTTAWVLLRLTAVYSDNLKCYGQKISGLRVNRNGSSFQVDIHSYVYGGYSSALNSSSLTGTSSEYASDITGVVSTSNVVNVKGYDESGNPIALTSYDSSTGTATFASSPAKVTYGYQTGYNNVVMDVTIGEETDERHSATKESSSSGGGGGCNTGIGIMAISALMNLLLKKKNS